MNKRPVGTPAFLLSERTVGHLGVAYVIDVLCRMLTVVETPIFSKLCLDYWSEEERGAFAAWIAANPEAGDVIKGSGGCRKVRWSRPGSGKRGGVRVIHFNALADGRIFLLLIYAKSAKEDVPVSTLLKIKEALHAHD